MAGIKDAVVTLILKARNAVSPAVDDAASSLYDAQKRADDLVNELSKLDKQAQALRDFDTLSQQTEELARAMRDAQENAANLQNQLRETKNPSAALRAEFTNAKTTASLATAEYKRQQTELSRLSSSLSKSGIDTKNLGTAENTLKQRIADTSAKAKQAAVDMGKLAESQDKAKRSSEGLSGALGKLKGLLLAGAGAAALRGLVRVTDEYKSMEGQLKLVTDGQEDLNSTMADLHQLANDTLGSLDSTVSLYARMTRSTKDLNLTDQQRLNLTRAINQSYVVSGASAEEAANSTRQFGQALASGVLRGDEFNSLMESSPRLARAMAEGLGVPIGQLRALAENGELTAEKITQALLKTADTVAADFQKMPETVGQALTKLHNDIVVAFGSKDATAPLTEGINEFRDVITDPGIVAALTSLAGGLLTLGKWVVECAAGFAKLSRYIGEEFASAINGIALDDLPRLTERVQELHNALNQGPLEKYGRRVLAVVQPWTLFFQSQRDVFKSTATLNAELEKQQKDLELGTKLFGAQTAATKDATKATEEKAKADAAASSILNDMTAAQGRAAEAAKALGIDMNAAISGISTNTQKLLDGYTQLSTSVRDMGATTEQQATLMAQAFDKVLSAADNKAALEALKTSIKSTFDAGLIGADQYQQELDQINKKQAELTGTTVENTGATQDNTAAKNDNADASRNQANAQRDTAGSADQMADSMENAADAGVDLLDASKQITSGFEAVRGRFQAVSDAALEMYDRLANITASVAGGAMTWQQYMKDAAAAEQQVSAALERQQAAVDRAMSMQNGNLSQFIAYAQQALSNASLLGDQQLSGLRSALQSARQQMQGLRDDAASTLNNLESALAQARGNAEEVERLRYEQQAAQLQDKLEAAQAAGDKAAIADLQKALALAKQLHDQNVQNAAQQASEQQAAAAEKAKKDAAAAAEQKRAAAEQRLNNMGANAAATKGVNINIRSPDGKVATVTAPDQKGVNDLLRILEDAGMRLT